MKKELKIQTITFNIGEDKYNYEIKNNNIKYDSSHHYLVFENSKFIVRFNKQVYQSIKVFEKSSKWFYKILNN